MTETEWISLGVASDTVVSETTEDTGDGWNVTTTIYDDGGWSVSGDVETATEDEPPLAPEQGS